jgi:hypothetical protein
MSAIIACDSCGKKFKAPAHLAGKRVRCKCGSAIAIPAALSLDHVALAVPEELDLSSASGLISASGFIPEAGHATTPCPSCDAAMPEGAVLCTACGFNTTTGKQMAGASAGRKKKPKATPKPKDTRRSKGGAADDGMPTIGARLWKLSKIVIVLGVLGGMAYGIRGALKHNPAAEARAVKGKIYNGMTIEAVVKAVEMPPREVWIEEMDTSPGGDLKLPKRVRLTYSENFLKAYPPERLENGFEFVWKYSERDQLYVFFSEEGKVMNSEIVNPMAALGM